MIYHSSGALLKVKGEAINNCTGTVGINQKMANSGMYSHVTLQ